jgi:hypothetical protein
VFYLALGYLVSYLPYAVLAKALSLGIVPAGVLEQLLVVPLVIVAAAVALSRPVVPGRAGRAGAVERRMRFEGAAMTDAAAAMLQDAGIFPHRPELAS